MVELFKKGKQRRVPVGPLRLSTHPGMGSFQAATTIDGLMMAKGRSAAVSNSSCSARAFVKV